MTSFDIIVGHEYFKVKNLLWVGKLHQHSNRGKLVVYKVALLAISKITSTWELLLETFFTTTVLFMGHAPSIG